MTSWWNVRISGYGKDGAKLVPVSGGGALGAEANCCGAPKGRGCCRTGLCQSGIVPIVIGKEFFKLKRNPDGFAFTWNKRTLNCNVTSLPSLYFNVHDTIAGVFAWLSSGRAMANPGRSKNSSTGQ